jgi:integrase/recombinase XerD
MREIRWDRYPSVAHCAPAQRWLRLHGAAGLAANTIDAYGRALADYLGFCADRGVVPEAATREDVVTYVGELVRRPHRQGRNVVAFDSGAGRANATLQQRLVALRLFYDYLVEEGQRETNPVGRGRYTAGKGFGGQRARGLVPRYTKLPWIPSDEQWQAIVAAMRQEAVRNRLMFALGYDAALRREELCALCTEDLDPA